MDSGFFLSLPSKKSTDLIKDNTHPCPRDDIPRTQTTQQPLDGINEKTGNSDRIQTNYKIRQIFLIGSNPYSPSIYRAITFH